MLPKPANTIQNRLHEASSLMLVTALCGAGGALTTTAEAAVIATPGISPATPLNIPATTAGVYVNAITGVNSANPAAVPGWDINPFSASGLNFFNPAAPAGGVYADFDGVAPFNPGNLPTGFIVSASTVWTSGGTVFGAAAGQWALNASGYFGFRFTGDDSLLHYGYGRIDVGATATVRTLAELYYEDQPNVGITVVAVPEPTGAFLAAGAAGLIALRRRRQAA